MEGKWIQNFDDLFDDLGVDHPHNDLDSLTHGNPEPSFQADPHPINRDPVPTPMDFFEFIDGLDVPLLTKHAFKILLRKLHRLGNNPSEEQEHALWDLICSYTAMATGDLSGRYAFPFPCGAGKTQSIVAFCQALAELSDDHPEYGEISVAISASKVEALCDLKRDMVRNGVPEEWIGLFHSYRHDKELARQFIQGERLELPENYASEPCTEHHDQKRILLCTHNRVRRQEGVDLFNIYKGGSRSLLIYDESLIKSDAKVVKIEDLQCGLGHFRPKKGNKIKDEAVAYLDKAMEQVEAELKEQEGSGRPPKTIDLPYLDDLQRKDFLNSFDPGYENTRALRDFLRISENPLRVLKTRQGEGVIRYELVVSPDLKNIIVLDASHNIRDLLKYDNSICGSPDSFSIDYSNLTIHQLNYWSGRHSMEEAFPKDRSKRLLSLEIYEVIKQIPENEGILIFVFKKKNRGIDFEGVLRDDLRALGIDTEATVQVRDRQGETEIMVSRSRLNFLTWGNETSLSSFSFCRNVICLGVLHRNHLEIGGLIAGQADNLLTKINQQEIQEAVKGEVTHCLYQALSRGCIRKIIGPVTEPMNAWIIDKLNDVRGRLKTVLPGAQWVEWIPKYLVVEGRSEKMARMIEDYLDAQEEVRISTKKIKVALHLQGEPKMTFTKAVNILTDHPGSMWKLEGRSLVRFNPFGTVEGSIH